MTYYISCGDTNGIGLEITLKALSRVDTSKDVFIFSSSYEILKKHSYSFNISTINSLNGDFRPGVYNWENDLSAFERFSSFTQACTLNSATSALVTGPMSKASFPKKIVGHTDFLTHHFDIDLSFMTFLGEHYHCLLLTDHMPLSQVESELTPSVIEAGIQQALSLKTLSQDKRPVALLGLNPHAGEQGKLGSKEGLLHEPMVKKWNIAGPLPSDSFFSLEAYKQHSVLIANYHDQGLIPFKLIHGLQACQTTLGLPIVRTSVDHGTACDLFLKGQADESSMVLALKWAKKLLEVRRA